MAARAFRESVVALALVASGCGGQTDGGSAGASGAMGMAGSSAGGAVGAGGDGGASGASGGAAGDSTGGAAGGATCTSCMDAGATMSCAAEAQACATEPECAALETCIAESGCYETVSFNTLSKCTQAKCAAHLAGATAWQAFADCAFCGPCLAACGAISAHVCKMQMCAQGAGCVDGATCNFTTIGTPVCTMTCACSAGAYTCSPAGCM